MDGPADGHRGAKAFAAFATSVVLSTMTHVPQPPKLSPLSCVDAPLALRWGVRSKGRVAGWLLLGVLAAAMAGACGSDAPTAPDAPIPPLIVPPAGLPPAAVTFPSTYSASDLVFCVDETNRYRTMAGLPLLSRAPELEDFARVGAQDDGRARQPYRHFRSNKGIATAENLVPWWSTALFGTVSDAIAAGLAQMWATSPNGEHYQNIVGNWTSVGCGIYIANGTVTVVQDFK